MINSPVAWLRCCALPLLIAAGGAAAAQPLVVSDRFPSAAHHGWKLMPDGALLVSDDHAGVIYRIGYKPARWAPS